MKATPLLKRALILDDCAEIADNIGAHALFEKDYKSKFGNYTVFNMSYNKECIRVSVTKRNDLSKTVFCMSRHAGPQNHHNGYGYIKIMEK